MTNSERYAFETFANNSGVLSGQPFKIFPVGKFYREDRVLNITPKRLQDMATNFKNKLPRFRVPINVEHERNLGKFGTIQDVEYQENGEKGPGLYATRYELTDEGRKLIEQEKFDAVSGEVLWELNNAKYQDPETSKYHDNVLVGVAFTATPYFSHNHVALFSAKEGVDSMADDPKAKPKKRNGYTKLKDDMKAKMKAWADDMAAMLDDGPHMESDEEEDEDEDKKNKNPFAKEQASVTAPKLATSGYVSVDSMGIFNFIPSTTTFSTNTTNPQTAIAADPPIQKGVPTMTQPTPKPEGFSVTAEEFSALKAKAEKAAQLEEQFTALKTQNDQLSEKFATEKRGRRLDQLVARCETFTAIPEKAETLADKMLALETFDAELAKYFDGLLSTLDTQIAQSKLFSQIGSPRQGAGKGEDFTTFANRIHAEKFGGDPKKYEDAMSMAAKERPDLFAAYNETYAPSR